MPRLFIAIRPAPETAARIHALLQPFREAPVAAHWTAPENLHLTLKFLGATEARAVPEIQAALARVAAELGADLPIALSGIGSFRGRDDSRTLWLAARNPDVKSLSHLVSRLETELAALGIRPEPRPFHAHVTVARAAGTPALAMLLERMTCANPVQLTFTADALILFESRTLPAGAVYTEIARAPFIRKRLD